MGMLLITRCNLPQINPGKATNHYRIVGHSDQVLDSQLEELGSNIDANWSKFEHIFRKLIHSQIYIEIIEMGL